MAKGSFFDSDLLKLIFNNTAITGIADAATTGSLTNLYVSLHTADPGAGGDQTTSEVVYGGYQRKAVPRSSAGWTVSGNQVTPASSIQFPIGTSGSGTVTNWAIGTALTGAGKILYTGTVSPSVVVGNQVTPILTTSSVVSES